MRLLSRARLSALTAGFAALLMAAPVRAADVDPYVPADSETIMIINIKQIFNSALLKKVGLNTIRDAINAQEEAAAVLKDLGLDPLKDIDKLIVAGPATDNDQEKGLIIVRGRFDLEKLKATAEKAAKDNKDNIKIVKEGDFTIYEVNIAEFGQTLYVSPASKTVILGGMSKTYLVNALKTKGDAKPALKNKAFAANLGKLDDNMSLGFVVAGEALKPISMFFPAAEETLAKIAWISGGFTVTDGFRIDLDIDAKTADDAKSLQEQVNGLITTGKGLLALAGKPELKPIGQFLDGVKTTTKGKTVSIKAEMTAEMIEKLRPKDQ